MPNLFPAGYDGETITADDLIEKKQTGYRNGVAWDEEAGDFVRDGKNMLQDSTGIESWKQWCVNCLETERYKHRAYSTDFGIEMDAVFGATSLEEAESILVRQITEAIMADPYRRCSYIEGLNIEWTAPDAIQVYLVIHGVDDVTIDITAYITGGGS